MKVSQLRQLIREEIRGVLNENLTNEDATLIKKNSTLNDGKPLKVGDLIIWDEIGRGGMGRTLLGRKIGKVVKILGSANLQAEEIKTGDLYTVSRRELTKVPGVGDKIEATLDYNYGAGSGSQGSNRISGIVKKVNLGDMTLMLQYNDSDKPLKIKIFNLRNVKFYS